MLTAMPLKQGMVVAAGMASRGASRMARSVQGGVRAFEVGVSCRSRGSRKASGETTEKLLPRDSIVVMACLCGVFSAFSRDKLQSSSPESHVKQR